MIGEHDQTGVEPDGETGEQQRQRVAENLRRLKAANRPREEIDAYLESERTVPVVERDVNDRTGAMAQTAVDAATFGLAGLGEDALTSHGHMDRFQQNRDLRAAGKKDLGQMSDLLIPMPGGTSFPVNPGTLARVSGSLLNPVGRLTGMARKGAGVIRQALNMGREGAAQAGAQALGEHIGTTEDPTGLRGAGPAAAVGTGVGTIAGGIQGTIPLVKNVVASVRGKNLGDRAQEIAGDIADKSGTAFGAAEREGNAVGSTPEIKAVLSSQTIKPFADKIRASESFAGADDATVLREAYKLMSRVDRQAAKQTEGTPDFLADVALKRKDIGLAKGRALDAADTGMPSLRPAVEQHRLLKKQQQAFERGSDMAERVILGKDVAGKKLLLNSPAAWEKEIQAYTPEEAQRALEGVRGRLKEVPELTSNPVGRFGIVSSTAKTILAPTRLQKYITLLEEKAGTTSPSSRLLDSMNQLMGRGIGSQP